MIDFDDIEEEESTRAEQQAEAEKEAAAKAAEEAKAKAEEAKAKAEEAQAALLAQESEVWGPWRPLSPERWSSFPRAGPGDKPTNMSQFKKVVNESVPGEFYGMNFPHSPKQLEEMGPAWLTRAFHASGVLPLDNEVVRFTNFDVKAEDVTSTAGEDDNASWGGAGCKVLLSVEYKYPMPWLSQDMFVKLPHEFTGKNERYRNSVSSPADWPEIMFYNTLGGHMPVKTPRGLFCEMSRRTTNFITIIERIPYGDTWYREYAPGEVLPPPSKYRDWSIPCGLDLYYAHARAMARFSGWHHEMRKETDQIEHLFMCDATRAARMSIFAKIGPLSKADRDKAFVQCLTDKDTAGIVATQGFPPNICQGFLDLAQDFVKNATHTFPLELRSRAYQDKFFKEAREMSYYCAEMGFYSLMMPEYSSLMHPNAQVDNAYYWRNESGEMECGLLDWGGCSHGNMPSALGNGWMGAEPDMMDEHEERLVQAFLDEYEKITSVKLDFEDFYMHFKLSQASVLYGCCANVRWLKTLISADDWERIKSRKDPLIDNSFLVRCYFVQLEMFLAMWKRRSPYTQFQKWMRRTGIPKKHP